MHSRVVLTVLVAILGLVFGSVVYPLYGEAGLPYSRYFSRMTIEIVTESPLVTESFGNTPYYYTILLQNARGYPLPAFTRFLPFEGQFCDNFHIHLKTDPTILAEYVGPMAQRRFELNPEHMHRLGIDEKISWDLVFNDLYAFPEDGIYRVIYDTYAIELDEATGETYYARVRSAPRHLKVYNVENFQAVIQRNPLAEDNQVRYVGCADDEKQKLEQAWAKTVQVAQAVVDRLETESVAIQIEAWFGTGASTKETASLIKERFEKLKKAVPLFNCGSDKCTEFLNTWFIPRDESFTVEVCPHFFSQDVNEAAMSLISTLMHFDKVAKTRDLMHGEPFIQHFVTTFPVATTLQNSDSYAFFARDVAIVQNDEIVHVSADV